MAVDKYGFVEVGGLSRISNVSTLTNPIGQLILSSSTSGSQTLSNGGATIISGSLVFPAGGNSTTNYIEFKNASTRGGRIYGMGEQGLAVPGIVVRSEGGTYGASMLLDVDYYVGSGGGPIYEALGNGNATFQGPAGLRLVRSHQITWRPVTDLTTTGTPQGNLIIGRYDTGSLYISGSGHSTLVGKDNHLTLSSTLGTITVSGSISMPSGTITIASGGIVFSGPNTGLTLRYTPANGVLAQFGIAGSTYFSITTDTTPFSKFSNNFGIINGASTYDYVNTYQARGNWQFVAASPGGTMTLYTATGSISTTSGHLILSSTAGSMVYVSGALGPQRVTTATLPPATTDVFTGSIVWDDTRKTMKIYGPLGWTPILTGAAG